MDPRTIKELSRMNVTITDELTEAFDQYERLGPGARLEAINIAVSLQYALRVLDDMRNVLNKEKNNEN